MGMRVSGWNGIPHSDDDATERNAMLAWTTTQHVGEVELIERPVPELSADEVLLKVMACGVCRTDLHVIDRELPVHRPLVVPGHQVVGVVTAIGPVVRHAKVGDVMGAAWLRRTCGACHWCRNGQENLCPDSLYTGWDDDGGFAEFVTVPEAFAYPLPADTDPAETAPLLCAGIIGYRALTRSRLPAGGRLGIYGFGSSAHVTAQLVMASGGEVYVMSRGESNRDLARALGAAFVGDESAKPPAELDSAIVFAPAGELVPLALQATTAGGTVVLAGIHMSDVPAMAYEQNLFHERDLRTVTANTRSDGEAFLRLASTLRLTPRVTRYAFSRTGEALADLRAGRSSGSLVVVMDTDNVSSDQ